MLRGSTTQLAPLLFAAGAALLALTPSAASAGAATPRPVTLRCTMTQVGTNDPITQYLVVDSAQKTVTAAGEIFRIGADPSGKTGKVITRWSDTEIAMINEEWIREGWQRFRIITVLDRLTGTIRSEDINAAYTGHCDVADTTKQLF